MTTTEYPPIAVLLARVMADVQAVRKTGHNSQQNYSFRGVDAVVNAVGPAMRTHGVVCVPLVEDVSYASVEVGAKRTLMRECTVRVRYVFHGPAGDSIECVSVGESMDSGDKSTPKAMSVAYRVALLQALCIPTDEPDVDSISYERSSRLAAPQWDPVEQEVLVTGWQAEIADATVAEQLAEIGRKLQAARRSKELSPASYDKLAKAGAARKAELNGGAG